MTKKRPEDADHLWVFGYGSLIWNPGFAYSQTEVVQLPDWQLRFWQSSEDHRGTPKFPGRVATIVPAPGESVWGRIFRIDGCQKETLAYLDHREKGGYERHTFSVLSESGKSFSALSYVGPSTTRNFVGPEKEEETAAIIRRAVGPSGANREYLRKLHNSLKDMNRMDCHVERLFRLVVRSCPHP